MQERDISIAFFKQFQVLQSLKQFKKGVCLFHIANERKCNFKYGRLLKDMGVMAGVADYCLLMEGGKVAFIEFKRDKRSKQNDNQKEFQRQCEAMQIPYVVAYTPEQAIQFIHDTI